MQVKIIADENIDSKIIEKLREIGFEVSSIMEDYRGIFDKAIMELSVKENALILTQDSDFGEWCFAYHEKTSGVIFLRYMFKDIGHIMVSLVDLLQTKGEYLFGKFTVLSTNKIRIRDL